MVGVYAEGLEHGLDLQTTVDVQLHVRENLRLHLVLVQNLMQFGLHVFHDGDQNPDLYQRIVMSHHGHRNGLQQPCLFLDGDEVGGDVALHVALFPLAIVRGTLGRPRLAGDFGDVYGVFVSHV